MAWGLNKLLCKTQTTRATMDVAAVTQVIVGSVLSGILLKVGWDWIMSGRVKQADYYLSTKSCDHFRKTCCVHDIKRTTNAQRLEDVQQISQVVSRLSAIEHRLTEDRGEIKELRNELKGISRTLDKLTAAFEIHSRKVTND